MKKQLVIVTTHFGTNFSGGSTATAEIFSRIQHHFRKTIVIGTEIGDHNFESIEFWKYHTWWHAYLLIKNQNKSESVFYGDFYNAFLFVLADVPFYFTYHDNWPEIASISIRNKILSFFYSNVYKLILKRSEAIITPSVYKIAFILKYSSKIHLIRNGYKKGHMDLSHRIKKNVLMVGNLDPRKYELAIKLFKKLNRTFEGHIDIFGHIRSERVKKKLEQFPFIRLMGFHETVPYSKYTLLLHTSYMEHTPIVFCEAIDHNVHVLAFDAGGGREVVSDSNGTLVPPYDLETMKSALLKYLSSENEKDTDKSLLIEFDWDKSSQKYLKLMA